MMQMDCYHMQIVEGDLATKLKKYAARCGHIQIAGVPGRHEPDNGEIHLIPTYSKNYDEIGYEGWIGCEYRLASGTVEGLGWSYGNPFRTGCVRPATKWTTAGRSDI